MSSNSSDTTLYGAWISPNAHRVLFAIYLKSAENNIKFQTITFANGDHKKAEYLAINPLGQVPALKDGDLNLSESRAIARYINDKYESGINLNPDNNIKSNAKFEQWISIESSTITPELSNIVFQRLFVPYVLKGIPDESIISNSVNKSVPLLDIVNNQLSNKNYFLGDRITLVDVFFAPVIANIMLTPEKALITSRLNISQWWSRIECSPEWKKVQIQSQIR